MNVVTSYLPVESFFSSTVHSFHTRLFCFHFTPPHRFLYHLSIRLFLLSALLSISSLVLQHVYLLLPPLTLFYHLSIPVFILSALLSISSLVLSHTYLLLPPITLFFFLSFFLLFFLLVFLAFLFLFSVLLTATPWIWLSICCNVKYTTGAFLFFEYVSLWVTIRFFYTYQK